MSERRLRQLQARICSRRRLRGCGSFQPGSRRISVPTLEGTPLPSVKSHLHVRQAKGILVCLQVNLDLAWLLDFARLLDFAWVLNFA